MISKQEIFWCFFVLGFPSLILLVYSDAFSNANTHHTIQTGNIKLSRDKKNNNSFINLPHSGHVV